MSAGRPWKCTGRIALVFGVIFFLTSEGSMVMDGSSMSAKTGFAPAWITALAVEQKVMAGTMTSSPGLMPAASMARCSAAVQELTAAQCLTLR